MDRSAPDGQKWSVWDIVFPMYGMYRHFGPQSFATPLMAAEDIATKQIQKIFPGFKGSTHTEDFAGFTDSLKDYAQEITINKFKLIQDVANGKISITQVAKDRGYNSADITNLKNAVQQYKTAMKNGITEGSPLWIPVSGRDYNANYAYSAGNNHNSLFERMATYKGLETSLGSYSAYVYPDHLQIKDIYDSRDDLKLADKQFPHYGWFRQQQYNYGHRASDPDDQKIHTDMKLPLSKKWGSYLDDFISD